MWIGGHAFSCKDIKRGQNHVASDGDREQYVDTLSQKGGNGRGGVKGRRRQGENLTSGPCPCPESLMDFVVDEPRPRTVASEETELR